MLTPNESIPKNNFKKTWQNYYNKYENINDYKIGFEINLEINGEKKENIMLDPSNQHKLTPYLYAYLYDDIHNSGYYSHVTMNDVKDNTIYSSIKLYLHKQIPSLSTSSLFSGQDS